MTTTSGDVVFTIQATDAELDTITYTFVDSPQSAPFTIDPGKLTTMILTIKEPNDGTGDACSSGTTDLCLVLSYIRVLCTPSCFVYGSNEQGKRHNDKTQSHETWQEQTRGRTQT